MSLAIRVFGQLKIGATQANNELLTLYSTNSNKVPTGKAAIVKSVRLANTSASTTRKLTLNYLSGISGAANKAVSPKDLTLAPGSMVILNDELILVADDKLRASFNDSGTGDDIDVVLGGVERDQ